MALNLGVTSCQSLEISLDQFVRGEVLEGSNAYYCEKCKEKVCTLLHFTLSLLTRFTLTALVYVSSGQKTTVKRTCIKSLPSVLCIHLMRFGFDWESGRSIKYDEQIRVRLLYIFSLFSLNFLIVELTVSCCCWAVPLGAEHGALHRVWNGSSGLQRRGGRGPRRRDLRRVAQEESHHFGELRAGWCGGAQRSGTRWTLLLLHQRQAVRQGDKLL